MRGQLFSVITIVLCLTAPLQAGSKFDEADKLYRGNGVEKDYVKALELFEEAYRKENNEARTACFIGNLYFSGGYGLEKDLDKAEEWFYISVKKGQFGTYCRLICFYQYTKDYDKAAECAEILEKRNTISWANLSYVAQGYASAGRYDDAVRAQKNAVELFENSPHCKDEYLKRYQDNLEKYERCRDGNTEGKPATPLPTGDEKPDAEKLSPPASPNKDPSEYYIFTDEKDRDIKCRILKYNPINAEVTIQNEEGQIFQNVKTSTLSRATQANILTWHIKQLAASDQLLSLKAEATELERWKERSYIYSYGKKSDVVSLSIMEKQNIEAVLTNQSAHDLMISSATYIILLQSTEFISGAWNHDYRSVVNGTTDSFVIGKNGTHNFNSNPVETFIRSHSPGWKSEIIGFSVTLSIEMPDGSALEVKYSEPKKEFQDIENPHALPLYRILSLIRGERI